MTLDLCNTNVAASLKNTYFEAEMLHDGEPTDSRHFFHFAREHKRHNKAKIALCDPSQTFFSKNIFFQKFYHPYIVFLLSYRIIYTSVFFMC